MTLNQDGNATALGASHLASNRGGVNRVTASPRSFRVQPAEVQHLKPLARLHRAALPDTINSHLGFGHLERVYRVMMMPFCKGMVSVALHDGEVVGGVSASAVSNMLTSIVVDPEYRRMGIGRLLVNAVDDFFRAKRTGTYFVETRIANESAQAFYHRLGFTEIGRNRRDVTLRREVP